MQKMDYHQLQAHIQVLTELSNAAGEAEALNDRKQFNGICKKFDRARLQLDKYLAECGVTA